jgi:hypothetical protein
MYTPTMTGKGLEEAEERWREQEEHNYKWIGYTPVFDMTHGGAIDALTIISDRDFSLRLSSQDCDEYLRFVQGSNRNPTLFFDRVKIGEKYAIRVEQRQ